MRSPDHTSKGVGRLQKANHGLVLPPCHGDLLLPSRPAGTACPPHEPIPRRRRWSAVVSAPSPRRRTAHPRRPRVQPSTAGLCTNPQGPPPVYNRPRRGMRFKTAKAGLAPFPGRADRGHQPSAQATQVKNQGSLCHARWKASPGAGMSRCLLPVTTASAPGVGYDLGRRCGASETVVVDQPQPKPNRSSVLASRGGRTHALAVACSDRPDPCHGGHGMHANRVLD
jgi:hypothetical protein